jgi:ankyrin repeat protein
MEITHKDIEARQEKTSATPLIAAAINGIDSVVRILLDHGADTSARDVNKLTANDWALKKGHQHISELLSRVKKQKT